MKYLFGRVTRGLAVAALLVIGPVVSLATPAHAAGWPAGGGSSGPAPLWLTILFVVLGLVALVTILVVRAQHRD